MDPHFDYSPERVVRVLRKSLKRITVKSKASGLIPWLFLKAPIIVLFFQQMNDFIFLEIPEKKIALFYSYDKTYENVFDARDAPWRRSRKLLIKIRECFILIIICPCEHLGFEIIVYCQ